LTFNKYSTTDFKGFIEIEKLFVKGVIFLMKKILLLFLLMSCCTIAQDEISPKDSLNHFDSKKIEQSIDLKVNIIKAKLKIIDYIKLNESDSLRIFISYSDSEVFKSPDWLSNHERFFIEFYKENISFLSSPENYKIYLGLRDTIEHYNYYLPNYLFHTAEIFDSSRSMPDVNLFDFLLLTFRNKLKYMFEKYPDHNYVWDFLDFLYNKNLKTIDDFNGKSSEYHLKYPHSPFSSIVKYNFIYKMGLSKSGVMFGMGLGFYDYDEKSKNFFEERGNLIFYFDAYWSGIALSFGFGMFTFESGSPISFDNKVMPEGTYFEHKVYSLSTGYFFKLHRFFYLTPYLGLTYSELNTTSYEVKENSLDVGLPSFFGCQIGLKADYLLHHFLESELVPEGNIMLRCDIGLLVNNYNQVRSDLGKFSYQINFGALVALFGKEFEYEF
jgi:hypothetical protein